MGTLKNTVEDYDLLCNVKIEDLEDYMSENDDYFEASELKPRAKKKKFSYVKPSGEKSYEPSNNIIATRYAKYTISVRVGLEAVAGLPIFTYILKVISLASQIKLGKFLSWVRTL